MAAPVVLPDLQGRIDAASARRRPFVTLTYAQSLDGSISAVRGQPLRLSGDASMTMTHELRAMHDGIMVGVATMIADNPSLNVRLVPGESPRPLILDSTLRTPLGCKLLTSDSCVKPLVLTTTSTLESESAAERKAALLAAGAEIIGCAATPDGHVDLGDALLRLPASCRSVMVEGGAAVISGLLDSAAKGQGTWVDFLLLTVAPVLVGGLRGLQDGPLAQPGDGTDFPRMCPVKVEVLDGRDVIIGGPVPSIAHPHLYASPLTAAAAAAAMAATPAASELLMGETASLSEGMLAVRRKHVPVTAAEQGGGASRPRRGGVRLALAGDGARARSP